MVVNNPPLSSDYRVESSTLINAVQNHRDEVLEDIGRYPSDQTVFAVLGDINLADVCWSSYYASSEYSFNVLSALEDLNLFQLVNFPTILSAITLDLFWSNDPQRFVVYRSEKTYSDSFPIFAYLHVSDDDCFTLDVSKQMYLNKRFNTERFSCVLEPLYTKLYSSSQSDFLSTFDVSIKAALDDSCPKKSKRRLDFPFYSDSHSIHLVNELRTRKYFSNLSYMTQLESDFTNSVVLDEEFFSEIFSILSFLTHQLPIT